MLFFLIGFMGCGKTTFGRKVAEDNGYLFVDLDEYIENVQKASVAQIFEESGENAFREMERESLQCIIKEAEKEKNKGVIVACGGGTPCFFDNHAKMKEVGISIYLQENPDILAQRLWQVRSTRPLLQALSLEEMNDFVCNLLAKRARIYEDATVILAFPSEEKLAAMIAEFLLF